MAKYSAQFGNFNLTFGEKELPLLHYFEEIIIPAFTDVKLRRKSGDNTYLFENVEIGISAKGRYYISGLFVKDTTIQAKSKLSGDQLVPFDGRFNHAPYSMFILYLDNHRIALIKNQKESPNLRSFNSAIGYFIKKTVSMHNKALEDKELVIPKANLNLEPLPDFRAIKEKLKDVKKIKNMKLSFYPLNGDIIDDSKEFFGGTLDSVRAEVGSETGSLTMNSPKNINKVAKLIEALKGTVNPVLNVLTKSGAKSKITAEQMAITNEYSSISNTPQEIIKDIEVQVATEPKMKDVSEGNQEIYDNAKDKISRYTS